ncbi:glycosyltransferase [Streptomyces alkaliphilus]|uniref:D-inositol 3-phosphate glycosyltransferase n=1 Tax=Streptomyces alkaliphilus TaxID=1472722 RepID=A0A7W3Y1M5_9ACTN|nr:glycosyltransferase [Streptomyces alkaliphilus]
MTHGRSTGGQSGSAAGNPPGGDADRTTGQEPDGGGRTPARSREISRSPAPGPRASRRERLLLVSTNYAPERAGIGPYAAQVAEDWVIRRDAEVHVLAGMPHYPAWSVDPAWRGRWRAGELRDGVRVHRRRHTVPSRQTAVRRGVYEASILLGGLLAPPRVGRPDAVLAQMPSLAGGVLAARLARRHRVPFVPVVQDLMGAAAAQSGIDGGGRAAAAAAALERRVLAAATLVGVIHESFRDRVRSLGVPDDRIRPVPNWAHVDPPTGTRADTRARLGWDPDRTVLLHSGNMGLKQGLEVLVEAARLAPDLLVVLMGDGSRRDRLAEVAADVPNLRILPPAGDAGFPDVLAAADALVVTQRASVLDMSVPSKLTSYFTAARPVIASVADGGGTAEEIRRSDAGWLVPPEDPAAIVGAAREIAADPAAADAIGARGFDYARTHLGREAGLARISALLDEALAVHRPGAAPHERKDATA